MPPSSRPCRRAPQTRSSGTRSALQGSGTSRRRRSSGTCCSFCWLPGLSPESRRSSSATGASRGVERQQLKWVALAGPFACSAGRSPESVDGSDLLFIPPFIAIPVAAGIAILRYQLFDVDRLINRTLVYGALTVLLGGAYVGLVLLGQSLSSSLVGGGNLAIAVSTLLVAALFLPLRSRVQRFVDRRFYRRRYDAQRTLEGFGARLREQVDLETLRSDLGTVVEETMQPAHVSVWLREAAR